jgi:hypothetical protein
LSAEKSGFFLFVCGICGHRKCLQNIRELSGGIGDKNLFSPFTFCKNRDKINKDRGVESMVDMPVPRLFSTRSTADTAGSMSE